MFSSNSFYITNIIILFFLLKYDPTMKRNTKKFKLMKHKNKTQTSQTFHLDQEQHQTALKAKMQLEKYSSSCAWTHFQPKNHSDVIKNWDQSLSQPTAFNHLQTSQFRRSSQQKYRKLLVKPQQGKYNQDSSFRKNISCLLKETKALELNTPSSKKSFKAISTNFDFDKIFNHEQAKRSASLLIQNLKKCYRPLSCKKKVVLKSVITVQPFSENCQIHNTTPKVKQASQNNNPKQYISYQIHKNSVKNNFNRKSRIKNYNKRSMLVDINDQPSNPSYLTSSQQSARNSKTPHKLNSDTKKYSACWVKTNKDIDIVNRTYKTQNHTESPLKQQFQRLTKLIRQQVNSLGYSGYNPIYIKKCQ